MVFWASSRRRPASALAENDYCCRRHSFSCGTVRTSSLSRRVMLSVEAEAQSRINGCRSIIYLLRRMYSPTFFLFAECLVSHATQTSDWTRCWASAQKVDAKRVERRQTSRGFRKYHARLRTALFDAVDAFDALADESRMLRAEADLSLIYTRGERRFEQGNLLRSPHLQVLILCARRQKGKKYRNISIRVLTRR